MNFSNLQNIDSQGDIMGEGISPQKRPTGGQYHSTHVKPQYPKHQQQEPRDTKLMTRQERERAKAQHILKTFDFNKLFHPRASNHAQQR